jgi:hypothetical protein
VAPFAFVPPSVALGRKEDFNFDDDDKEDDMFDRDDLDDDEGVDDMLGTGV